MLAGEPIGPRAPYCAVGTWPYNLLPLVSAFSCPGITRFSNRRGWCHYHEEPIRARGAVLVLFVEHPLGRSHAGGRAQCLAVSCGQRLVRRTACGSLRSDYQNQRQATRAILESCERAINPTMAAAQPVFDVALDLNLHVSFGPRSGAAWLRGGTCPEAEGDNFDFRLAGRI
jgi:hypothetical protein